KFAKDYGIDITFDEFINDGDRDYRILISKMLQTNPEIIIGQIYIPEFSIFMKQLKDIKPDVKVTNVESMFYPEDKSLLEGYWYIDAVQSNKNYVQNFIKYAGHDGTNYSEGVYTALEVIRDTNLEVGTNKEDMINFITSGHKFNTAFNDIHFSKEGIMQSEPTLKIIKNGKSVMYEEQ
ncbi:MAG: hypothetical protein LBL47_05160, partial [Lactobacillus sp.]|nr:hypothetical protein [Lactobacillus sp.]